jgi:hypothetical protein
MQVCKSASLQVCKSANLQVCKQRPQQLKESTEQRSKSIGMALVSDFVATVGMQMSIVII